MGGLQGTAITVLTKSPPLVEGGFFRCGGEGRTESSAPTRTFGRSTGLPRQSADWLAMTHLFGSCRCGGDES